MKAEINFETGIDPSLSTKMARVFGCVDQTPALHAIIHNMYKCFIERDLKELLINPLVLTPEGKLLTLGVKVEVDDAASFRQAELFSMVDYS
jgi:succinyl-CoA synthetase beta subunit